MCIVLPRAGRAPSLQWNDGFFYYIENLGADGEDQTLFVLMENDTRVGFLLLFFLFFSDDADWV